ncbi:fimbrial protein [Enterobacter kobei]|uniref:fimbrial protein n=1 Tax=Enterobacter kobei TaxID=208224 RepID=UPI000AC075FF|nr:fimbrial protein [Enterobacter kobei]
MLNPQIKKWLPGIALLIGLCTGNSAWAVITCKSAQTFPPETSSVALAGSFYAGNDLPIGAVIYRTTVRTTGTPGITCDAPFTVNRYLSVATEPSGSAFSLSGSPYTGEIYPTNVPGIGVALWYSGKTFTKNSPLQRTQQPYTLSAGGSAGIGGVFDVSLIKTGPIDSGSLVNGISIPTAIMYAGEESGYTGLPIRTWTVNFSGSIQFITQTCQTPDVNVEMGSYGVRQYFRGVGSTTPWVDSSIRLENCPTFTGYHGSGTGQSITGSGSPSGTTLTSNLLKVSLQPLTDFIDNGNGVFAVNASNGGSPATGIGLQLGYTPDVTASPTTPTKIWKNGETWDVTPPNSGTANFRIPLAARYYQTNNVVTPGPADGKVVFTINYN